MNENNKSNDTLSVLGAVGILIGTIVLGIFSPVIAFGLSFFGGWILQITIGDIVISGLNLLFDTDRFKPEMLPLICATLGMIGGYFKASLNTKNDKDKL